MRATATGSLANTASINAPTGTTDPTPGNNGATDTDTLVPTADLQITKTDSSITEVPGTPVTYTIVATNNGPSNVIGATITDTIPSALTNAGWTCTTTGGATCGAAFGTGDITDTINLPTGSSVTYTLTADVRATATGTLTNTASITAPTGVTDPTPANNTAVDTDTLNATADLTITKTDGATSEIPGTPVTYTIVATNNGPSNVTSATITDTIPSALTNATWTCAASPGATCTAGGTGNITDTVNLPSGASATYTLTADVRATATGSLTNTASISAPTGVTDPTPANNTATDTDTLNVTADLTITKTDSATTEVPGTPVSYTIIATNNGPSNVVGATIVDLIPAALTASTWTCVASPGATCTASGTGTIADTVNLPSGATVTYTLNATVRATATGSLTNTASINSPTGVTDPTPANNTATDSDTLVATADLTITKTDSATTEVPGTPVTYTIVATNNGPSNVVGATITDTIPSALTNAGWTCATTGGATCGAAFGTGDITDTINLPAGATVTYTLTADVRATATGNLANIATITAPSGVTDPTPANNTATDTDTLDPTADLQITKTDSVTTEVPGTPVTYTIVATNNGPSNVVGATITDTIPSALTNAGWTCIASAGATCATSGTGNVTDTINLPTGSSVTYTLIADIGSTATGSLTNTATVSTPTGITDPTPSNNTATDTDVLGVAANLSITKTDGITSVAPGTTVTYTIVATNSGPSAVTGAVIADTLPSSLSNAIWSCVTTAGATCTASGTGSITDTVNLPVGASVTYSLNATVRSSATGNLVNTSTISAPTGVSDTNPADNTATDTDTLDVTADLTITKTDGATSEIPGTPVTYTIVATNNGPSDVVGATITDTIPAALTNAGWTCAASAGATCTTSGTGNITDVINLPAGATATYTLNATVRATATGNLANTAIVNVPAGTTDPNPTNNTFTDIDSLMVTADLSITKTDGAATEVPGTPVVYTIVATNNGPSNVVGATISDTVPAALTNATWTCAASTGATCTPNGTGNITDTVNLPVGATATYTLNATVRATASGSLTNTASISVPTGTTDPTPGNNGATDTDTLVPTADLQITKTDGATSEVPGTPVTYTIIATNNGPSNVLAATINDTIPSALTNAGWTCATTGGATCGTAFGTGDITDTINLPTGSSVTYTLTADVRATATGTLTNTASITAPTGVTDPTPANNTAVDTDTLNPTADLTITKTDGSTSEIPGTPVTYTIIATNNGPSAVTGATITDTIPSALTNATWTCVASTGATCTASETGNITDTVNLPAGATATYTLNATVRASATGNLTNTASITVPTGVTDLTPANNTATDTDTLVPTADLTITKTDSATSEIPGTPVIYTIVATNNGPSNVVGATITDTIPAAITNATWTCATSTGATCTASGTGNITDTVNLPAGATATYTLNATVRPSATGNLTNTASITAPTGVTDPTPANNTATDTDTLNPTADLTITKTDGSITEIPGTPVTYTIVATNNGPSNVTSATITDTIPAALTNAGWTCAASTGATCGTAFGTGDITDSVNLPAGATVTYTLTADVQATATGTLTNTASITAPTGVTDPTPANNTATDTDTLNPTADLTITKTDGSVFEIPGTPVTYTIVATNNGPSNVTSATITDTIPSALTNAGWTCVAAAGATCGAAFGTGDITDTVSLPATGSVTYTVTADVRATATGTLTNAASINTPTGVTDPTPANNTATDTDALRVSADLSVTKTDGATSEIPGTPVTYTIVATNNGPSDVTGATITDTIPSALTNATWTCVASTGATCTASGTGNITDTVDLPTGGSATYTLNADVRPTATGNLTNTASITAPTSVVDLSPTNNTATDTDTLNVTADLTVTKTDGTTSEIPGTPVTYTIVATNNGPSNVTGATIADTIPSALTNATWTCVATNGATCTASGTGNLNNAVTLPVGATVTYTVNATVRPDATGNLTNTAGITAPTGVDPNLANNTATDTDTLDPTADVRITKTDGLTVAAPGAPVTYTITVANTGPSSAPGVTVTDVLPGNLNGVTWSCVADSSSACSTASGTGNLNTTADLGPAGTVTYTVQAQVDLNAAGSLTNTATVAVPPAIDDPNTLNNTATDTDTLTPTADMALTKTDNLGTGSIVAGTAVTYTITATNRGPSRAIGLTLTDPLPASLSSATWTCSTVSPSSCGTAAGSGSILSTLDLEPDAVATFTLTATLDASATGSLVNTATVTYPTGLIDPTPGPTTATDLLAILKAADLVITKTDGATSSTPGLPASYTITVTNAGPSDVVGAVVTDTLPSALINATWNCTAGAGSSCGAISGAGSIATTVDLVVGASATFTLDATVDPAATGPTLGNTAQITPPTGVVDPNPSNSTATDTNDLNRIADLSITKTDARITAVAGSDTSYTITVHNDGPSAARAARIVDSFGTDLTRATWTCTTSPTVGITSCPATGTGAIDTAINLEPGASATFVLSGTINPALRGTITNTATVSAPSDTTDPDASDDSATDTTDLTATADVSITKTDGVTESSPGARMTYTVNVSNAGPSTATNVVVTDVLATILHNATWTCTVTSGSCPNASGTGSLSETIPALAPNAVATFRISARVDFEATGTLTNTASVTSTEPDADTTNNSATDVDTLVAKADLQITKTDNALTRIPGLATSYAITVTNAGPSNVTGASIADAMPSELLNVAWSCAATGGATCPTASGAGSIATSVDLPAESTVTFAVNADISAGSSGLLRNTATVTSPSDVPDPDPSNNTSTDETQLTPETNLRITKTDHADTQTPGDKVTYDIEVTNEGPSYSSDTRIKDVAPDSLRDISWTCEGVSGATCPTDGTKPELLAQIPPHTSIRIKLTATIDPAATGVLKNIATVAPATSGVDKNINDDEAIDESTLTPKADLTVTKDDGVSEVAPGRALTYKITVTNHGPSNSGKVQVTDQLPSSLIGATWSCVTPDGCGTTSGTGDLDTTVNLAPDQAATFEVRATVNPDAEAGELKNIATAALPGDVVDPTPAPTPGPTTAQDIDDIVPETDLSITKTHEGGNVVAGGKVRYTITVANNGPSTARNVVVTDVLPASLLNASWTCAADIGSACDVIGTGSIDTKVTVRPGAPVVFTLEATVDPAFEGSDLANTASVTPSMGSRDITESDNSATDHATVERRGDVSITKTDGRPYAVQGRVNYYRIVVTNHGPSALKGVKVTDHLPGNLHNGSWKCEVLTGSASCQTESGDGDIDGVLVDLGPDASVSFVVRTTVDEHSLANVINSASVEAPADATDPVLSNNKATDNDVMWKEWLSHPPVEREPTARVSGKMNLADPTDNIDSNLILSLTGSEVLGVLTTAGLLLMGGYLLILATRRRRRS